MLPRILLTLKELNPSTIIEWDHKMVNGNKKKSLREHSAFKASIDGF
jgi:hypothetical protein